MPVRGGGYLHLRHAVYILASFGHVLPGCSETPAHREVARGRKGCRCDLPERRGRYGSRFVASAMGHTRLQHYLEAQEIRQAQAKEERENAAAAAAMATRVEEVEEATAALHLDLEAEDGTAATDNKKEGKASAGGSKKKKM